MKSSMQAYAYADANGFKYSRQRIGRSIYRHADGRTLEIGHDLAEIFRAAKSAGEKKNDRLLSRHRYEKET